VEEDDALLEDVVGHFAPFVVVECKKPDSVMKSVTVRNRHNTAIESCLL
jgi:hypothetical protein